MDSGLYIKLSFPLANSLIKHEQGGLLNVFLNSIHDTS